MALWALGILLSISLSSFLPFWDISELSKEIHHICLHKLNFHTPWADIYKSLTCGKRLEDSPVKDIFVQGGLIHLTVVSGAHLLFLENFWKKLPGPAWLKTHGPFHPSAFIHFGQSFSASCPSGFIFFLSFSLIPNL